MYPDLRLAYKLQTLPVPSLRRITGSLNIDWDIRLASALRVIRRAPLNLRLNPWPTKRARAPNRWLASIT